MTVPFTGMGSWGRSEVFFLGRGEVSGHDQEFFLDLLTLRCL